jgi:uncharacterized protein involved in exopolysaccharide biosynthesis
MPSASLDLQGLTGKLGSLASLTGLNLGGGSNRNPETYRGILYSRRLLEEIIYNKYSFREKDNQVTTNLVDYLEVTGKTEEIKFQKTLKAFREGILVANIDPDNLIMYISVTLENAELAAQVANLIIIVLDKMVINKIQIEYTEQHQYLMSRIKEINDSLKISEDELKRFLEKHPDPTVPEFQIEQIRLRRKVEILTAVLVELTKQQEILNVQNYVYLSPIKVLDDAFPPYKKSKPKRIFVTLTLLLLTAFFQVGVNGSIYFYNDFRNSILPDLR